MVFLCTVLQQYVEIRVNCRVPMRNFKIHNKNMLQLLQYRIRTSVRDSLAFHYLEWNHLVSVV